MPNFVRWREPGGIYFFTLVTGQRRRNLTDDRYRPLLHEAFARVQARRPFEMCACVLLPDHLHCIWRLPARDDDFPTRWREIKSAYTRAYLRAGGPVAPPPPGQARQGRRGVWHGRYWEHRIRNEEDYIQHRDYIHFNPVKHGLVKTPEEWRWSSVHQHLARGELAPDWWSRVRLRLPDVRE